jgi:hypothetical protein
MLTVFCHLLVFGFMFIAGIAYASEKPRVIIGDAVAISGGSVAWAGYVYADVLISQSKQAKSRNEFICVRVSVPASMWHQWLVDLPSIHKFRVRPAKIESVEVLEHEHAIDGKSGAELPEEYPVWEILSGGKKNQLPFGKQVPTYESWDWPMHPGI